jgi:hypothetical protein
MVRPVHIVIGRERIYLGTRRDAFCFHRQKNSSKSLSGRGFVGFQGNRYNPPIGMVGFLVGLRENCQCKSTFRLVMGI